MQALQVVHSTDLVPVVVATLLVAKNIRHISKAYKKC